MKKTYLVNKQLLLENDVIDALMHNGGTDAVRQNENDETLRRLGIAPEDLSNTDINKPVITPNDIPKQTSPYNQSIFGNKDAQLANQQTQITDLNNRPLAKELQASHEAYDNSQKQLDDQKLKAAETQKQLDNQKLKAAETQQQLAKQKTAYDDSQKDLQKHTFGKTVFGSEDIANKLNSLSAGQLAGAAAGTGAVLGTGGHILGSTLSKRLRGAK